MTSRLRSRRRRAILLAALVVATVATVGDAHAAPWETSSFSEDCRVSMVGQCYTDGHADAATGELEATAALVAANSVAGDQAAAVAEVSRTLLEPAASRVRYRLRLSTDLAEGANASNFGESESLLSWSVMDEDGVVLNEQTGRIPSLLTNAETLLITPPGPGSRHVTVGVSFVARATMRSSAGEPPAGVIVATISGTVIDVTAEPA